MLDLGGPSNQNQEGRLKGVFSLVRILQHAATNLQDRRTVPGNQTSERSVVTGADKIVE
jgi:hypothetical protein